MLRLYILVLIAEFSKLISGIEIKKRPTIVGLSFDLLDMLDRIIILSMLDMRLRQAICLTQQDLQR